MDVDFRIFWGKDLKKGGRKNVEVFDLERYFPVTLPLRPPSNVEMRMLDDEEFGGEEVEVDEDEVEPARELDLMERSNEDMLFFFQIPTALPQLVKDSNGKVGQTTGAVQLEKLHKGSMGKLVVYESGAVKLKLGSVLLDALPGTECMFAQELAAVNTTSKTCCFLGDVTKRVILTPDVNSVISDGAPDRHSRKP